MIPRYPMPTSGVGPNVPGRSTTWITADAPGGVPATRLRLQRRVLDDRLGAEGRTTAQESRAFQAAAERLGVVVDAYGADHLHKRLQFGRGEVLDQALRAGSTTLSRLVY